MHTNRLKITAVFLLVWGMLSVTSNLCAGSGLKTISLKMSSDLSVKEAVLHLPYKKLSQQMKLELKQRARDLQSEPNSDKPSNFLVNLGLNHVPIKNQGFHGSCATFATTTAVDAALFQTDYISELCLLQALRQGKNAKREYPWGWNGAYISDISGFIEKYGIINKDTQRSVGCGGFTEYPIFSEEIGQPMSLQDYTQNSQSVRDLMSFKTILDSDNEHFKNRDGLVQKLKDELNNGHRIIVGLGMVDTFNMGFVGTYKKPYDTWILTYDLLKKLEDEKDDSPELFGHAVVIYGYDDSAAVNGQRGVFFVRNSWGGLANSDNYVTYDYVRLLMGAAIAVEAKSDTKADMVTI